jgi:hypothetical protein
MHEAVSACQVSALSEKNHSCKKINKNDFIVQHFARVVVY